jgi:hypothetical protein
MDTHLEQGELRMCALRTEIGLSRWEDEGGAPQARRHSRIRHSAPADPAASELYYFNVRSDSALAYDPEGSTLRDIQAAVNVARALARGSLAEGHRRSEDRRAWQIEITDRAHQHVATFAFAEAYATKWPRRHKGGEWRGQSARRRTSSSSAPTLQPELRAGISL